MRHFIRPSATRSTAIIVASILAGSLLAGGASRTSLAVDPFQFTQSPVPIGNVTATNWYGNTELAYEHRADWYSELQGLHSGVDFLIPIGNPITSRLNRTGTVISINNSPINYKTGPGNVVVDYGDYLVLYGHTMVTPPPGATVKGLGDPVSPGDIIAYSGADSQPLAHLHLEVIKMGCPLDARPGCIRTNPVPFFSSALHDQVSHLVWGSFHHWPNCNQWEDEDIQPDVTPGGPLLEGCMTSPGVDVALIIDSSGSMASNDPDNKRLDAARSYVTAALPGDGVAVIDFATTARLASGLLRVPAGAQDLRNAIAEIPSNGSSTNIRAGITTACDELKANGQATKRGAILLTDGLHNEGAFGTPQQCFIDNGWPIYSIGFGSADMAFLQGVSNPTGGEAKLIGNVSNLVCEFQVVRAKIAGGTPPPCTTNHVDPMSTTHLYASVPPGQAQATFSNTWTGSDIVMTLIAPSGRTIDRNTIAPDVSHDKGPAFEVYSITNPEPGDWKVDLYGADVPVGGEDAVFGFSTVPDATPPVGYWDAPADGITVSTPTVDLAAHATDAGGSHLASISFSAKWGGDWHGLATVAASDDAASASFTWDVCATGVPDGDIELGLEALDNAGNRFVWSESATNHHITKAPGCGMAIDAVIPAAESAGVVVADLAAGALVTIDATGRWCMGGSGAGAECGSPDGIRSANRDEPGLVLPSAKIGALIGRVGLGGWFLVGSHRVFSAATDGDLTLAFNDLAYAYGDNSSSVDVSGTASSGPVEPTAPTVLKAIGAGPSSVKLTWGDSVGETGYRVSRLDGSTWVVAGTAGADSITFVDRGLSAGSGHWYELCAVNTVGETCAAGFVWGAVKPTSVVLDDRSTAFTKGGTGWHAAASGYRGHLWWARVHGSTVARWGQWKARLSTPGRYRVYAYVPSRNATTRSARYVVYDARGSHKVTVNQRLRKGWVYLGTFTFGSTVRIKLTDATGERASTHRRVAFDAVRLLAP